MHKVKLRTLVRFDQEHSISIGNYNGRRDFYTCTNKVRQMDLKIWGSTERNFKDPWLLMDMPVKTLAYVGGPEGAALMEGHFPDFKFPMFAGKPGADIVERQAS